MTVQTPTSTLHDLLDDAVATGVCSAAAAVVLVGGDTAARAVVGTRATTLDDGGTVPVDEQVAVGDATRFDLASLTKTYSARALLELVRTGVLGLDDPVAEHLASYRGDPARRAVTLRHLLTHTSGLPATWEGWRSPFARALAGTDPGAPPFRATPLTDQDALRDDLEHTPLGTDPGARWEYACTGYNTAMLLAEASTGESWPDLVDRLVLRPLGLRDTGYVPRAAGVTDVAAAEHQPALHRGVVSGDVHDESSWSLGGRTANAGLFGTLDDVAAWAESIRRGEDETSAEAMWDDQLPTVLRDRAGHPGHGASLGLRIGERSWMGEQFPAGRGHTGFTGTSFVVDRELDTTVVLLTNRVHPTRTGPAVTPLRLAVAALAAGLR